MFVRLGISAKSHHQTPSIEDRDEATFLTDTTNLDLPVVSAAQGQQAPSSAVILPRPHPPAVTPVEGPSSDAESVASAAAVTEGYNVAHRTGMLAAANDSQGGNVLMGEHFDERLSPLRAVDSPLMGNDGAGAVDVAATSTGGKGKGQGKGQGKGRLRAMDAISRSLPIVTSVETDSMNALLQEASLAKGASGNREDAAVETSGEAPVEASVEAVNSWLSSQPPMDEPAIHKTATAAHSNFADLGLPVNELPGGKGGKGGRTRLARSLEAKPFSS
jgi:hypothetical protein